MSHVNLIISNFSAGSEMDMCKTKMYKHGLQLVLWSHIAFIIFIILRILTHTVSYTQNG